MSLDPIFKISIQKGRVIVQASEKRMRFIQSLPDGEYEEIIRKRKKPRSNEQNRYMHGVIFKLIAEEIGDSPDEVKSAMKNKFLKYQTAGGLMAIRDTSDLSTVELEEFNEKCRRWASSFLNLYIPNPNEVEYSTYD